MFQSDIMILQRLLVEFPLEHQLVSFFFFIKINVHAIEFLEEKVQSIVDPTTDEFVSIEKKYFMFIIDQIISRQLWTHVVDENEPTELSHVDSNESSYSQR